MKVFSLRSSVFSLLLLAAPCAFADDVLDPPTAAVTNIRSEAVAQIPGGPYYEGTTLRLTNNLAYSGGSTSSAVQGLAGMTVEARVGDLFSSTAYTGTVQVATAGTWTVSFPIPSNYPTTYLQTKLTDSLGNTYIYPLKIIKTAQPLR